MQRFIPILLSLLLPFTFYGQSKYEWVKKKSKGGLEVYTRLPEDSPFKELKLVTTLEGTFSSIVGVFADIEASKEWVYSLSEARLVEYTSPIDLIYYSVSDFPWPFQDRDAVLHSKFSQDPETLVIFSESTSRHEMVEIKKNRVRITEIYNTYQLTSLGDGKVELVYYLKTDPGGNVPPWLVNLFIDKGPVASIIKLKEMLLRDKYKNMHLDYIIEPHLVKN